MRILPIILSIIFLSACSSLKVSYDYDKEFDFTTLKTFKILPWADEMDKIINDLDKRRIETALINELQARGLKKVESGADMAVSVFIVFEQKTSMTAYNNYYGMGYGAGYRYGGWGWGGGYSTTTYQEHDYLVGTAVFDVFSDETKSLVWQGTGSGTVNENPKDREERLEASIRRIFASFPVDRKKGK